MQLFFWLSLAFILVIFTSVVWIMHPKDDVIEGFIMTNTNSYVTDIEVPDKLEKESVPYTGKAIVSDFAYDLNKMFPDSPVPIVADPDGYAQVLYLHSVFPKEDPNQWFDHPDFKTYGVLIWETKEDLQVPNNLSHQQRSRMNTLRNNLNIDVLLINRQRWKGKIEDAWDVVRRNITFQPVRKPFDTVDVVQ